MRHASITSARLVPVIPTTVATSARRFEECLPAETTGGASRTSPAAHPKPAGTIVCGLADSARHARFKLATSPLDAADTGAARKNAACANKRSSNHDPHKLQTAAGNQTYSDSP